MTDKTKSFIEKSIEQIPSSHLSGQGCYKCGNNTLKTTEQFIIDAKNIFGDKYDYSKVEYKGAHVKVIISCSEHGDFEMKPNCHLSNQGCYKCGRKEVSIKLSLTKEEFIKKSKKVHGDKYDYSKVKYNGNKTNVIIICKIHGEFLQKPNGHLSGNGCTKCAIIINSDRNRKSLEQFIIEATQVHGNKYDYSKVEYLNTREKIIIICKIHGEFLQSPEDHTHSKAGCPRCMNKTEGKFYNTILNTYPNIINQFKVDWCKNKRYLPYDFCIPEHKIIIELDGRQHFQQIANWGSPEEQFENDKYKEDCANQNGYSIIRLLQEDVFYDTYDWVKELCNAIEEIKTSNEITNLYLCKNDEYDKY
jgi:very-short-patch-repair endonuclease